MGTTRKEHSNTEQDEAVNISQIIFWPIVNGVILFLDIASIFFEISTKIPITLAQVLPWIGCVVSLIGLWCLFSKWEKLTALCKAVSVAMFLPVLVLSVLDIQAELMAPKQDTLLYSYRDKEYTTSTEKAANRRLFSLK